MARIKTVQASQILESGGYPTVEVAVVLEDGTKAKSSFASGSLPTHHESLELRDGDESKFNGKGVLKAVDNVNQIIAPSICGMESSEQQAIDRAMIQLDNTPDKSKLGTNAILPVSQAIIKATAKSANIPLFALIKQFMSSETGNKIPFPMFDLIEGGKHGINLLNFQEFLVIPASSKNFQEGLELGISIYHALKKNIEEKGKSTMSAKEGGFSPDLATNQEGLAILKESIEKSGYSFSFDVFLGIDASATSYFDGKVYKLKERSAPYKNEDLVDYYKNLVSEFSLIYLEDPCADEDWDGWKKAYGEIGEKTLISGDDLVSANPYRLQLALQNKVIGALVIKPGQIGTVTEAIAVIEMARFSGLKIIVSNRSGETGDTFISDFAVGVGADYVKFGAPSRERIIKYNRLLEIENEMKSLG